MCFLYSGKMGQFSLIPVKVSTFKSFIFFIWASNSFVDVCIFFYLSSISYNLWTLAYKVVWACHCFVLQVVTCSFIYGGTKAKAKTESETKDEKFMLVQSAENASSTPVNTTPNRSPAPNSGPSAWPSGSQVDVKNSEIDLSRWWIQVQATVGTWQQLYIHVVMWTNKPPGNVQFWTDGLQSSRL